MALRCCVLLVCFAKEIFGYRNCSMSLILLYWWIISEPGNTNCLGSYSFNLCFVVVEQTSLSFPPAISPLLSLPSHQSQLMGFPCNILAITSFSLFPSFGVQSGFSIQLSSHFSLCPGSSPFLRSALVTDSLPPGSGTAASLAFLTLIRASASPSTCVARSSCASLMQEGSASVRPSFVPHRRTSHTSGSSMSFCQLPRPQSTPPWSGQTNTFHQKHTM